MMNCVMSNGDLFKKHILQIIFPTISGLGKSTLSPVFKMLLFILFAVLHGLFSGLLFNVENNERGYKLQQGELPE